MQDKLLSQFEDQDFAEYVQYATTKIKGGDKFEAKLLTSIKHYPVSIREFITSEYYLDQAGSIYPLVMDELEELNNPKVEGLAHGSRISNVYTEAVFTGGIGVGKSHCSLLTIAYQLYILSCMDSPQGLFDLDISSEILFVFQTINATLAKQLDYARFKSMIEHSPYFREVFQFNRDIESELQFPNRIIVRPVSGLETATIGQNIFGGVLDEVNFMEQTQNSKKTADSGGYDQALQLYNSISSRRKSRFMKHGRALGMLCLVSSKRYPNQFTDQKVDQANRELASKGSTSIYIYDKTRWEIKPDDFCGDRFKVFAGDLSRKPRILLAGEEIQASDLSLVTEIPVEYRPDFETDILRALREIAGQSTLSTHPFLVDTEAVSQCFGKVETILSDYRTDFAGEPLKILSEHVESPSELRFIHVDLALSSDSAGVVCGYVSGFKQVDRGEGIKETLPIINIDFSLEVAPPKGGEIEISKIRTLICKLRDLVGVNVRWVSFDQYQSADSMQILRQKGFTSDLQSMDRTMAPYELLKQALYDQRVNLPDDKKLLKELLALEFDVQKSKVDHTSVSTKDISDALAGVVYGISRRNEVWHRWGINPYEQASRFVKMVGEDKE